MALSSDAPWISPFARNDSTSWTNPNVRAGPSSRTKRLGRHAIAPALPPNHRVREVDRHVELELRRRRDLIRRLAVRERHRRSNREVLHLTRVLDDRPP